VNNLINIVKSPTRISNHSIYLIDLIIVNNRNNEKFTVNQDFVYSDNLDQLLYIKSKNLQNAPITTCKGRFTDKNVEEFQYLLQKENWNEVSASNEPNTSWTHLVTIVTQLFP
jgi:hypothetical protein